MLKFSIKTNASQQIKKIADTIRKATTLESFTKSPELPLILGRCVQRTIDAQKFKPLSPKYRIVRVKKFGNKPILRLTDSLYKRTLMPGFFTIRPANSFRVLNIKISDLIGNYQQALGRDIFRPDDQMRRELLQLAKDEIAKDLKK